MSFLNIDYEKYISHMEKLIAGIPTKHHLRVEESWRCIITSDKYESLNQTDCYTAIFVLEGNGKLELSHVHDDNVSNTSTIELIKDWVLFISPNNQCTIKSGTKHLHLIMVQFNIYDNVTKNRLPYESTAFHMAFIPGRTLFYEQLFLSIHHHFLLPQEHLCHMLTSSTTEHLVGEIYNTLLYHRDNSLDIDSRIFTAKHTIDSNPCIDANITDLAKECHMSPQYFSTLFKKSTGMSPKQYILRAKMLYACTLIRNNHYSIKNIATIVGYPDQYSFSKQFKKVIGCSPSKL